MATSRAQVHNKCWNIYSPILPNIKLKMYNFALAKQKKMNAHLKPILKQEQISVATQAYYKL